VVEVGGVRLFMFFSLLLPLGFGMLWFVSVLILFCFGPREFVLH